ncbi:hypothetical protein [Streptomyces sp. NPDC057429]|uniref:hypothetical protein n=1 Tax=Streptomyces sp. NPDC057429 TaxID=3346130 RepID=UPI00367D414E
MTDPKTTAAQRHARTLTAGQRILIRRLADRAAAWVRAGRRDDLDGLAAILGCALRLVLLTAGAYGVWLLVRRWPGVLWAAVPVWCWAAVRALPKGARIAEEKPEPGSPSSPDLVYDATLDWIHQQIAQRNGVHLSDLLSHAQAHGMFTDLDVPNFRATLERWHIPVRQQLKVGGRNRPGIHRDDLPPRPAPGVSPGSAQEPLPTRSTAA